MRKMLKKQGFVPKLLVTDKLRSYAHLIETTARPSSLRLPGTGRAHEKRTTAHRLSRSWGLGP